MECNVMIPFLVWLGAILCVYIVEVSDIVEFLRWKQVTPVAQWLIIMGLFYFLALMPVIFHWEWVN